MQEIKLQDAKATLSAVIDRAWHGNPSITTRHGRPEAVVLSFEEWQRLSRVPSFGRLLMAAPVEPDDLPARQDAARDVGSERPGRRQPALGARMDRNSPGLYLSVITIAEMEDGIARFRLNK